jgi:AraC-like DNA-binding protein
MSQKEVLYISNLYERSTILLLQEILMREAYDGVKIQPGKIILPAGYSPVQRERLLSLLAKYELQPVRDHEEVIVEQIRLAVHELVHELNFVNSVVNRSDYIIEKTGYSYSYLSRLFSKRMGITLEKYIIQEKIRRVEILLQQGELSLSEIANMMGYSSVQYLSNQFRQVTGLSVSDYKKRLSAS